MENATKALLIAAAVLVAILLISLGVGVFQMGEEATQGANLSEQEVMAFNQKFEQYAGQGKRGSEVNALLKTVVQHNIQKTAEGSTDLRVTVSGSATISGTETTIPSVSTGAVYNVVVNLSPTTGLVTSINITT